MNKTERIHRLLSSLESLGFTHSEAQRLRRIEMTLHRWAEGECGDGNNWASWSIERDEETDIPYRCVYPHDGKMRRHRIPDREKGALRRLAKIVAARNARYGFPVSPFPVGACSAAQEPVVSYHQGDPRGCALYILRRSDIPAGATVDQYYTRGLAVCA